MFRYAMILVVPVILTTLVCGCTRTTTEYSAELTEQARVVQQIHTPAVHGVATGTTLGMNLDGDFTVGVHETNISTEQKFATVFECQHGKFIVEREETWRDLKEGQDVTVTYREVYRVTRDGDRVISTELVDYDFLSAK